MSRTHKRIATQLHSRIVRARGECEKCGSHEHLQCAHIISRRYSATRTDPGNAFCLCAGCHMHYTEWPVEFAAFIDNQIGVEAYERLRRKALNRDRRKVDWATERAHLALIEEAGERTHAGMVWATAWQ